MARQEPLEIDRTEDPASSAEMLEFEKTIRIAVTGDVFLTRIEYMIIDTPDFQRLRGVRQLGTVSYVYPTAIHTRFDHSLGTLAMADRMFMAITQNAASEPKERQIDIEQRRLIRLYALLHDIPHVPFGHTIEDELGLFNRHDDNPERILHFLGPESDIGKIIIQEFNKPFYDRLLAIYLWEEHEEKRTKRLNDPAWKDLKKWLTINHDDLFIHDIVGNTLCADLLDYLARDNYFCNLGIFLEYRFLNFLYLKVPDQRNDDRRRLFVRLWKGTNTPRRDILTDLARLLEHRYMLAERAYFHHTKLITGAMLGRALQEYSGRNNPPSEAFLYFESDDSLLRTLADPSCEAEIAQDLSRRLRDRRLYKTVHKFDESDFSQAQESNHDQQFQENTLTLLADRNTRREVEDELAAEIGEEPGSVLIYAPPYTMNMKVARVNVRWKGRDTILSEIDDPVIEPRLREILTAHQMLWGIWIFAREDIVKDSVGDFHEETTNSFPFNRVEMIVESFRLRFLVSTHERIERQQRLYERILRLRIMNEPRESFLPFDVISKGIRDEAEALTKVARDDRTLFTRINSAIQRILTVEPPN